MKDELGGMMNIATTFRARAPLLGPDGLIVEPSKLTHFFDPSAPPLGE